MVEDEVFIFVTLTLRPWGERQGRYFCYTQYNVLMEDEPVKTRLLQCYTHYDLWVEDNVVEESSHPPVSQGVDQYIVGVRTLITVVLVQQVMGSVLVALILLQKYTKGIIYYKSYFHNVTTASSLIAI